MSEDTTYNGWTNYETWHVNLWITGDAYLYSIAKECEDYDQFIERMEELERPTTPDHVAWDLPCINRTELNEAFKEL